MSNGGTLPQEIITDLLSRLPVKTLCRFKCVSPSWKSRISDPDFTKTHLNQTITQNPKNLHQKVIIISSCGNLYSLDLADVNPAATKLNFPPVKVLSSYDGLLLVRDDNSNFLLNPSTREHKVLPTLPFSLGPYRALHTYGIGYDSFIDDYKVLIISSCPDEFESSTRRDITVVAVYSLKTNAWRRIPDHAHHILKTTGSGVFFNGCYHYVCSNGTGSFVIVAFDLSDEIFREVLPPASFTSWELLGYNMEVLGGHLCLFVDQRNDTIMLWTMEEYGVRESWTSFSIDMPKMPEMFTEVWSAGPISLVRPGVQIQCFLAKDEILLKTRQKVDNRLEDNLFVYNSKTRRQRGIVNGSLTKFTFGCTYVESLISPNYGEGIGRQ